MRIAFADFSGWDFHVQSVETMPLGGSQSAACYLALELAGRHEVFFISRTTEPGVYRNVTCLSWDQIPVTRFKELRLDVFVAVLAAGNGVAMRGFVGPETRLVLWTQHRIDQPDVQTLADLAEGNSYDGFVFASEWQREEFGLGFGLPLERTTVLGNAIAPAFLSSMPRDKPILPMKAVPPVMAYTSTPFRGLHLLLDAFPKIRERVPDVRLRVFSSMAVYHMAADEERARFGALYERCRQMPGVEYVGSLPQPALAREMGEVAVLAYPNIFPETFCIAALEAMASGCRVVTTAQGALPETTAGFAELVPVVSHCQPDMGEFIERTIAALDEVRHATGAVEEALRRQVEYVREHATWPVRAAQWEAWLDRLGGGR